LSSSIVLVLVPGFCPGDFEDQDEDEDDGEATKNSLSRRGGVVFNQGPMSQTHPLTTTTFELPGYRVTKSFGVVRGIMVRSRSVVGNIGASIQSIFGGNITLYTDLCERAREDTFNLMLTHAGQLGANAVVGVRYDATEIAPGITEVLCYGTAVFVEKC
jgi:uncharacterized protein YbjQ (UPF0145 family)